MAEETFTAEITFSGLCLILASKCEEWDAHRTRGPKWAGNVEVLLVDSRNCHGDACHQHDPHYPRLTYYAEDHIGLRPRSGLWEPPQDDKNPGRRPDAGYLTSPEGKEVVTVDLTEKKVEIIPPWPYVKKWSRLRWCEVEPGDSFPIIPNSEAQDRYLDWMLRSDTIGFEKEKLKPSEAVSHIYLPNGTWETRGAYRNREVSRLRPIRWKIGKDGPEQAIARDIVLRLDGLRYGPTIRISSLRSDKSIPQDLVLTPGIDRRLRFAISNLPRSYSDRDTSHVRMFEQLSSDPKPSIREPYQIDDVVCQLHACDSTIMFK